VGGNHPIEKYEYEQLIWSTLDMLGALGAVHEKFTEYQKKIYRVMLISLAFISHQQVQCFPCKLEFSC
jgi:hypothetical protein